MAHDIPPLNVPCSQDANGPVAVVVQCAAPTVTVANPTTPTYPPSPEPPYGVPVDQPIEPTVTVSPPVDISFINGQQYFQ